MQVNPIGDLKKKKKKKKKKIPTLRYNRKNRVIIMNAMILNIMHDIYNVRGT